MKFMVNQFIQIKKAKNGVVNKFKFSFSNNSLNKNYLYIFYYFINYKLYIIL